MANLTGKIIDVTNQPPGSVVDIHVKAPSARVGSGTGAVVSSPATVDYDSTTGELTITNLTGGLSWLVIEGAGWSDTVALAVAEGMTTLVEAIANAAGAPGMTDYVRLLASLELAVEGVAVEAVADAIDSKLPWRGVLPDGTDINLVREPGIYTVANTATASTMINWPTKRAGILTVWTNEGAAATVQEVTAYVSTAAPTENYSRASLSNMATGWSPWTTSEWAKSTLPDGTDLGTFRTPGLWIIAGIINAKTIGDMPTDSTGARVEGPALLEVVTTASTGRAFQTITVEQGGVLREFARSTGLVASWPAWQEKSKSGGGGGGVVVDTSTAVADHAARVEYARSRRGGGIGTGGKAVVMLRFDHWLVAFRDKVLPILRKYQLPATLNMNYDNMKIEANGSGSITWADVQDWNQRYGIEIANHGSTHTNPADTAGIYHEIVDGRRNLEAAMPRVAVETWQEHGSAYLTAADIDGDIGLNLGREPKNFFESYAGRLVLAEHAVIEGKSGGFFVNLSGEPQIGQSHFSADRDTAETVIGQVTTAQTLGRGVTLYTHPGSMNNVLVGGKNWPADYREDGTVVVTNPTDSTTQTFATEDELRTWADTNGHIVFMPFKDFDVFCAHLAAERDAGRLMVMTAAGGAFADIRTDYRENLLVKSDFTDGYSSWWVGMSGWTVNNPGPDVTLTSTSGAGQMNQAMLLHSRFGWAMGAVHELLVRVSATTETTLTLRAEQMGNASNWNVGETFTVPGDGVPRDYRLNVSLPRDPTISQIRWFMGGPSMTIHGAPLLAAI